MRAALSKAEIETEIASRFGDAFKLHEKGPADVLSSGIPQIDSFTGGGLPRGAITEIFGPASSGRTSFMLSALAYATAHDEVCTVVDTGNVFDPISASLADISWSDCSGSLRQQSGACIQGNDYCYREAALDCVILDLADVLQEMRDGSSPHGGIASGALWKLDANCPGRDRRGELREILRRSGAGTKTTSG